MRRKLFVSPFAKPQGAVRPNRGQANKKSYTYRKNTRRKFSPGGFDTDKMLRNHIDNVTKKSIERQKKPSFDSVAPFVEEKRRKRDFKIRTSVGTSFHVGPIPPPANGTRQDDSSDDTKMIHKVEVKSIVMGSDPSQEFRRKIETGRPTTKSLLRAAKENGTTRRIIYDSYNSAITDGLHFTRKQLTVGTGFNQRGFTVFGAPAYMTYGDMLGITDTNLNNTQSAFKMQTLLAGIMSSKTEMLLRNQSAHLRAYVRVHLVSMQCGEVNDPVLDMSNNVSHGDVNAESIPADLKNKRMPVIYQYTDNRLETGSTGTVELFPPSRTLSFDTTTKGNILGQSPYFKENFKICATVSQNLGPGDFFRFSHVHHYGSGFDLANLYSEKSLTGPDDPGYAKETSYFYIVEYKGHTCEATFNNAGAFEARIGTAPVLLNAEIRKSVRFVNAPNSGQDQTNSGVAPRCLLRVFEQSSLPNIVEQRRDFNSDLANWTTITTPALGLYVIQVSSDRTLRGDVNQAGNSNATDIVP